MPGLCSSCRFCFVVIDVFVFFFFLLRLLFLFQVALFWRNMYQLFLLSSKTISKKIGLVLYVLHQSTKMQINQYQISKSGIKSFYILILSPPSVFLENESLKFSFSLCLPRSVFFFHFTFIRDATSFSTLTVSLSREWAPPPPLPTHTQTLSLSLSISPHLNIYTFLFHACLFSS